MTEPEWEHITSVYKAWRIRNWRIVRVWRASCVCGWNIDALDRRNAHVHCRYHVLAP